MLKNNIFWKPVFMVGTFLFPKGKSTEYHVMSMAAYACIVGGVLTAILYLA